MKTKQIAIGAVAGAAYAALTIALAPISYGPVQFRAAEALTILPFICPYSAWGLFVGCVIANLYGGYGILDIVFGSLATLAAGLLTARIKIKWLAPLPPVIINGLVVGTVLAFSLTPESVFQSFFLFAGQVALGEFAVCYFLGLPLLAILSRIRFFQDINKPL
jgi:uncharacterized membrane protein